MLSITLPTEIALLKPVRESEYEAFASLMEFFVTRWQEHWNGLTDDLMRSQIDMGLAQKIVDLVPRLDKPGYMGFDVSQIEIPREFEELFFVVMVDGHQTPPKLAELQRYERFQSGKEAWKPGENLQPHHLPVKPTDMPRLDLFTKLAHAFSVSEAKLLQELLCPAEIDRFLCHYNEVSKPFEERKEDVKEKAWQGFIESEEGQAIIQEKTGVVTFEKDDD